MTDDRLIEPAEPPFETGRIGHYDELPEPVKETFPQRLRSNEEFTPAERRCLREFDYVKFTDYYRIR